MEHAAQQVSALPEQPCPPRSLLRGCSRCGGPGGTFSGSARDARGGPRTHPRHALARSLRSRFHPKDRMTLRRYRTAVTAPPGSGPPLTPGRAGHHRASRSRCARGRGPSPPSLPPTAQPGPTGPSGRLRERPCVAAGCSGAPGEGPPPGPAGASPLIAAVPRSAGAGPGAKRRRLAGGGHSP